LEIAERLFGDYGVEGVSIRQIGLEAKAANKSAVSYHFGGRADLVRAIWMHRLPILDQMRRALLDKIGMHRYAAFLRSVMRWREGRILRAQEMHASPASQEGLEMLSALAANIPPGLLRWRLSYAAIAFLDMIVDRDHDLEEGHLVLPESRFLQEAIDMVVAHCFRPEPPPDLGLASLDHRLTSN
jgi:AcrR family transcriptional regulator